jgi:hypothetical protein
MTRHDLLRAGFLLVAVCMAGSGVFGLIARTRVPTRPPRRQLVASLFRLAAGLVLVGVIVLGWN